MLDLLIKNGQCYIDGELKNVDVSIKDGKIQDIGQISEKANDLFDSDYADDRQRIAEIGIRNLTEKESKGIKDYE